MKVSITYFNWFRRLVTLGALVGVGVFASTAAAVSQPPDIQDIAATIAANITRPPDITDAASQLSLGTSDVLERYASQHPYGAGLALHQVSRPPDVSAVAAQLTAVPDVFERYASEHAYGTGLTDSPSGVLNRPPDIQDTATDLNSQSSSTLVSRPPDVQDATQAVQSPSSILESRGFHWSDWGIGIGTGIGLTFVLSLCFLISRQHRRRVQPA